MGNIVATGDLIPYPRSAGGSVAVAHASVQRHAWSSDYAMPDLATWMAFIVYVWLGAGCGASDKPPPIKRIGCSNTDMLARMRLHAEAQERIRAWRNGECDLHDLLHTRSVSGPHRSIPRVRKVSSGLHLLARDAEARDAASKRGVPVQPSDGRLAPRVKRPMPGALPTRLTPQAYLERA